MKLDLLRRAIAEALGTAMLLTAVVGSGIMGDRLAGGNLALALLANTIATGATLVALILSFGSISGAHFNPAVTLADPSQGGLAWRDVPAYLGAQLIGAFLGVASAHLMFGLPLFSPSVKARSGSAQIFSEFVATFGLIVVVWGCVRFRSQACAICRSGLHRCRRLVHLINIIRESSRNAGTLRQRYLRGNPSG